jgi:plastocyanin
MLLATSSFAVKRIVSVSNFLFSPSTFNVNVGDTMRWVWVAGFHTTTSGTIPAGAAAWNAPIQGAGQFFEYKITTPGTYNYFCAIHSLSMLATFTASAPLPTISVTPPNQNAGAAAGSTSFTVTSNTAWTTSSNASWCTATPGGTGNGIITANFSANPDLTPRIATITSTVPAIPAQVVTVTQSGAPLLSANASAAPASVVSGQNTQLDVVPSGGTGTYGYSWSSVPAGFVSSLKNPVVSPLLTTVYTCTVTSGSQSSSPAVTVTVLPPAQVTLQNMNIPGGQTQCYDASQTISVAGQGTSFIVENGAIVMMVSGQNILYFPGTIVNSGGNMHGYIVTDNQYCSTIMAPTISGFGNQDGIQSNSTETWLKVFPNPTTGLFTLQINGELPANGACLEISAIQGGKILHEIISGEPTMQFSLSGYPAGVYILRLVSGRQTETIKVVKQ